MKRLLRHIRLNLLSYRCVYYAIVRARRIMRATRREWMCLAWKLLLRVHVWRVALRLMSGFPKRGGGNVSSEKRALDLRAVASLARAATKNRRAHS